MKNLILSLFSLVVLFLPTIVSAEEVRDPRLDMVVNYYNVHRGSFISDYEEKLLFGIESKDIKSLVYSCDRDVFVNERITSWDDVDFSALVDKTLVGDKVEYFIDFHGYEHINFFGALGPEFNDVVVKCDVVDVNFLGNKNDYTNSDVVFTLGETGVFNTTNAAYDSTNPGRYLFDDEMSFSVYLHKDLDRRIVNEIEMGCYTYGDTDPFKSISIYNDGNNLGDLKLVSKENVYNQKYNNIPVKEGDLAKYYTYRIENMDYDMRIDTPLRFDFVLNSGKDSVSCSVNRIAVIEDGKNKEFKAHLDQFHLMEEYLDYEDNDGLKVIDILNKIEYNDGFNNPIFKSYYKIHRAEAAKILSETFFEDQISLDSCFYDVDENDWYYEYACNLKDKGIISGTGYDQGFYAGGTVNLVDAYKMIFESIEGPEYFDNSNSLNWYDPYVEYANERFIGFDNRSLSQSLNANEFLKILYQAMNYNHFFNEYDSLLNKISNSTTFEKVSGDNFWNITFDVRYVCELSLFEDIKRAAHLKSNIDRFYDRRVLSTYDSSNPVDLNMTTMRDNGYDYELELLGVAANSGCKNLVSYYLDRLPEGSVNDVNAFSVKNILHVAIDNKDMDLIEYLVEKRGADVSVISMGYDRYAPIHFAMDDLTILKGNEIQIIDYLVENGADINYKPLVKGGGPLPYADIAATDEIKEHLLEKGYVLEDYELNRINN